MKQLSDRNWKILSSPRQAMLGQVACPITLRLTSLPHNPSPAAADALREPLAPNTADAPLEINTLN